DDPIWQQIRAGEAFDLLNQEEESLDDFIKRSQVECLHAIEEQYEQEMILEDTSHLVLGVSTTVWSTRLKWALAIVASFLMLLVMDQHWNGSVWSAPMTMQDIQESPVVEHRYQKPDQSTHLELNWDGMKWQKNEIIWPQDHWSEDYFADVQLSGISTFASPIVLCNFQAMDQQANEALPLPISADRTDGRVNRHPTSHILNGVVEQVERRINISPSRNQEASAADLYDFTLISKGFDGEKEVEERLAIRSAPMASFNLEESDGCKPIPVMFSNNNTAGGDIVYWDFGDGVAVDLVDTTTYELPEIEFSKPGTYTITLSVSNLNCFKNVVNLMPQSQPDDTSYVF
ncbi:MAG: PKD domain-containing protein, partial [Bacteroidota bacterium]